MSASSRRDPKDKVSYLAKFPVADSATLQGRRTLALRHDGTGRNGVPRCASAEARDRVLASPMEDGIAVNYGNLDELIAAVSDTGGKTVTLGR